MLIRLRTLIVALLLLAFGSQLMAAAQGCSDMAPSEGLHSNHAMMNAVAAFEAEDPHAHHQMSAVNNAPQGACCDSGDCDMSQCSLAAALPVAGPEAWAITRAPIMQALANRAPSFLQDPLYHPPRKS
ncbi:hypothetical protein L1F30_13220 [Simiduia sp. 21SJ11W-1]|uniref:hypothetical protein n=1 Tax=Simiduia sp. 21SJ11W-1 TaxID=2909669 RepID=UPI00209E2089|nr:hypothetical protein [Simiduia sp. 21SJ11W-1]UTA47117.1 hypothetical protein L1F30_13220 [Simiduia sp. 21SJ11W-1]